MTEYRGLDIDKIAKGFYYAANERLIELRKYLVQRKEKEPVKYACIYVDLINKIDDLLK